MDPATTAVLARLRVAPTLFAIRRALAVEQRTNTKSLSLRLAVMQLSRHEDPTIRELAEKLWSEATGKVVPAALLAKIRQADIAESMNENCKQEPCRT